MSKLERQKLTLPTGHDKLLLHSCCAPCPGEVMETLIESGINFSKKLENHFKAFDLTFFYINNGFI